MSDPNDSNSAARGEKPGKTRTLWHPLLERLLTFSLSPAYTVQGEVLVGKMPLRVDILLVRRLGAEIPDVKRGEVAALLPLLSRFTLIEFKAPTDTLERGDFAQLLGCAFLWHSQQSELVPREDVSLVVVAPRITGPFRDELRALGCETADHAPGVYRVSGLPFTVWLVETDVMTASSAPVLSLVSRIFLREHASIIDELTEMGYSKMAYYAVQLIHQLQTHREEFAVPTEVSDEFGKLDANLVAEFWASMPPDLRDKIPPQERLRGLTLEQRLAGLSDDEKAQLAELAKRSREN